MPACEGSNPSTPAILIFQNMGEKTLWQTEAWLFLAATLTLKSPALFLNI